MRLGEAESRTRNGFDRMRIGVLVLAGGLDPGQGDGACLHDHAILRVQIVPGLEDRGILRERDIKAIGQRQRTRDPAGQTGIGVLRGCVPDLTNQQPSAE